MASSSIGANEPSRSCGQWSPRAGDLVVDLAEGGEVRPPAGPASHQPVAVAALEVAGAERERALHVGARRSSPRIRRQWSSSPAEQVIEVGVRPSHVHRAEGRARHDADVTDLPPPRPGGTGRRADPRAGRPRSACGATVEVCGDLLGGADRDDHVPSCRTSRAWSSSEDSPICSTRALEGLLGPHLGRPRSAPRLGRPARTGAVVAGLADEHWRPAEMCLKVCDQRELGEAGPRRRAAGRRARAAAGAGPGAAHARRRRRHRARRRGARARRRGPGRTAARRPFAGAARPAADLPWARLAVDRRHVGVAVA